MEPRILPSPVAAPPIPERLRRAFSGAHPGPPVPPGPRGNPWWNAGAEPAEVAPGVQALADALLRAGEPHRTASGEPTSIPRRPIPSAGGAYPVQLHLVGPDGGRLAYDPDAARWWRRSPARERAAGWPSGVRPRGSRLVLAVQPGRSFGRYRHRAWPLWIADTAYALQAARFVLAGSRRVRLGPDADLRALLAFPAAYDDDAWLRLGLAPLLPLAMMEIADDPAVLEAHRDLLRERRSPEHSEYLARAEGNPPSPGVERVALASGQSWVRGASAVRVWSVPADPPADLLLRELWGAHLEAAELLTSALRSGAYGVRPVSGFSPEPGTWILHASALLARSKESGR